jgi:hypothetical protein
MAVYLVPDHPVPAEGGAAAGELGLIRSSIALVAAGAARRVTHVGLGFAPEILAEAQAYGHEHGVIVRCRWREPGPGCDIVVEPIG